MTTIACDGKTMAADSLITGSGVVFSAVRKIERVGEAIVACAGAQEDDALFLEWFVREDSKPELAEGFEAFVLNSDGLYLYEPKLAPWKVEAPFACIGSGWQIATGAMAAGATPKEAVEIACQYHTETGPPVVVEEL